MTQDALRKIRQALIECSQTERRQVFEELRREFPIHELEVRLNASAEIILEAIARASDLTLRGIRGIIAEASFAHYVVSDLQKRGWQDVTPDGDFPYDFDLRDYAGNVHVQVKMQRLEKQVPKLWKSKLSGSASGLYVVETQRTRTGKTRKGTATRPYRFGEFDILAVSLQPSTTSWADFRFTVANWLLPREDDPNLIRVLQPVSARSNNDWTNTFETAVTWFRGARRKTIGA